MIIFDSNDYIYTETKCKDCNGSGAVTAFWSSQYWEYCSSCMGKGVFVDRREITRFDIMDFDE
jgi:DnaJ-class molecular chaperone